MPTATFEWSDFLVFQNRTVIYDAELYQADGESELVLAASDVIRFKMWLTDGIAPLLDASSLALKSATFTAAASTTLTTVAHGLLNGHGCRVTNSGGALPSPLVTDKTYFVVGKTDDTFELSLTKGGTAITMAGAGTGTHTFTQTTSHIEVLSLGVANTTPAKVRIHVDQVNTIDMALDTYHAEISIVDDSDVDKIKPAGRGEVVLQGSSVGGDIGLT